MTAPSATGGLRSASRTDIGRRRPSHQDACAEFDDPGGHHLFVVADGMGGHAGGEIASRTAIAVIGETFRQRAERDGELLRTAFRAANERIRALGAGDPALYGLGTTAVALLAGAGAKAWVAHVGDSRAYRLRGRRLVPLTQDHSWVGDEVRSGRLTARDATEHPRRSVLLRCLGGEPDVEVDVCELPTRPGDRFVLCTDGLWSEVSDDEIAGIVRREDPDRSVSALVDLANEHGGRDNVTVQVVALAGSPPRRLRWLIGSLCAAAALLALAAIVRATAG